MLVNLIDKYIDTAEKEIAHINDYVILTTKRKDGCIEVFRFHITDIAFDYLIGKRSKDREIKVDYQNIMTVNMDAVHPMNRKKYWVE